VTRVSPSDHADAALVHNPAVSLDKSHQFNAARAVCQETYDDPYADDGVEVCKVLRDIVL